MNQEEGRAVLLARAGVRVCMCVFEMAQRVPQSESGKVGSEIIVIIIIIFFFSRLGEKLGSFASCRGYPVFKKCRTII